MKFNGEIQQLRLKSTLFIALLLVATLMVGVKVIPPSNAVHGNNPAILGIWHEGVKSNAVILSNVAPGNTFILEVNATDAGNLRGFDITIRYDSAIISPPDATFVDYNGVDCPTAEGCMFASMSTLQLAESVTPGQVRLSVTITSTTIPFASGTGTVFRIYFTVIAEGATMINIVEGSSSLLNPGAVPYQGVDGYLDSRNTSGGGTLVEFNYAMALSLSTVTVNRPVAGTASSPSITVTVTLSFGTTRPISLRMLGLPQGVSATFGATSGNPTFTTTVTLTINGGPAGGSTTAPSGTYKLAVSGNGTVTAGHFVRTAGLTLVVVPPPPPNYTISASPASLTIKQGGFATTSVTLTLNSGTAEPVLLSHNIGTFCPGCEVKFTPPDPTPTQTVQMNVSIGPTTQTGTYSFNITGTSTGLYSETTVVKRLLFSVTVQLFAFQIDSISASRQFAYAGVSSNPVIVTMTVRNNGTATATFNAMAKVANSTHTITIGTQSVTLNPGQTQVVTFNWNAHLLQRGFYAVYGETRQANPANGGDILTSGEMVVRFKGDVNNDCTVNIIDLALVGASFGSTGGPPASSNWNQFADLNNDNTINIIDLANVGGSFGQVCG